MDVVANYTPDDIDWYHGGANGVIKSGQLKEFESPRANYILNKYGPRGLLRMKWDDKIDEAQKTAQKRWEEFWTRQIINFNQDNERRMNTQKEYVHPTNQLQEHADRMGIKLVGPWTLRNLPADDSSVRAMKSENEGLRAELNELKEMFKELVIATKGTNVPNELRTAAEKVAISQDDTPAVEAKPAEPAKKNEDKSPAEGDGVTFIPTTADHRKLIAEFQMLQRDKFLEWVSANALRLQHHTYPSEVLTLVKQKWERLIGEESDFPLLS